MENILFINKFLKNWREIGSVTPSSKFLVEKMIKPINWHKADTLVELGPGSGCITKELLQKMKPTSKLFLFETDADFCKSLKQINDSRIVVYNDSALNLEKYLEKESVDCIVSGIPLATLDENQKESLLISSEKVLNKNGRYIQFQYSIEALDDLKNIFTEVDVSFTPLNIPPAFVFSCLKK